MNLVNKFKELRKSTKIVIITVVLGLSIISSIIGTNKYKEYKLSQEYNKLKSERGVLKEELEKFDEKKLKIIESYLLEIGDSTKVIAEKSLSMQERILDLQIMIKTDRIDIFSLEEEKKKSLSEIQDLISKIIYTQNIMLKLQKMNFEVNELLFQSEQQKRLLGEFKAIVNNLKKAGKIV